MIVTSPGGLAEVLHERADLAELYAEMTTTLWTTTGVDPVVLELCRLRIAQLHACEPALRERTAQAVDAGLTEELVGRLPHWPTDPAFGGPARAALAFTEKFAVDVHGITDAETAAVVGELGEASTVGLVLALGVFDGATRLRLILPATLPAALPAPSPTASPAPSPTASPTAPTTLEA